MNGLTDNDNIMTIDDLKNSIQSFDLIYSKAPTYFADLVNYFQYRFNGEGGIYSHIAMCIKGDVFPDNTIFKQKDKEVKIDKTKMYLFESDRRTYGIGPNIFDEHYDGVQLREFDTVIENCTKHKHLCTRLGYAKMNDEYRQKINEYFSIEENKEKFKNFVEDSLSFMYNGNTIHHISIIYHDYKIVQYLKNINDSIFGAPKAMVCSELIGIVLIHTKLIENVINVKTLLPEDFLPRNDVETMDRTKQIPIMYCNVIKIN